MASSLDNVVRRWHMSSVVMKIIIVNIAVFLVLRVLYIVAGVASCPAVFEDVISNLELPGASGDFIRRPWTMLTYMFTQFDVMHLLFNMIWLYWFGSIFMMVMPSRKILPLYIAGGCAGGIAFLLSMAASSHGGGASLVGSSAGVIAIVAATALMVPDYRVRLLFLGEVKLKWIALVTIGIDLLGLNGINIGGHIAHLGGALMGVGYALALRKGRNLKGWGASLFASRSKPGKGKTKPSSRDVGTEDIDSILDKIKRSGYTSLTAAERNVLFSASRRQPVQK